MADAPKRPVDPFEAFKAKKAEQAKQVKEAAANDEAARKAGWIDGIGPTDPNAKQDPTKPKGRYVKPPVNPAELAKIKPAHLEQTQLAKPKPTQLDKLAPEEKRRPKRFDKF
jgi:hypothetical protein